MTQKATYIERHGQPTVRHWDNLLLEARVEFGHAAHMNRGHYSGEKIHRIYSEYIVGLSEAPRYSDPRYADCQFQRTGQPVLFRAVPACYCTHGQMAARPVAGMTEDKVTCAKCGGRS